ncbi:spermatogenesis-associated serine-rich protein 1-like [Lingula anatina]|uniref:Spermatogenesis-associated serine-rich protein 1-like n=1 Tax=Lingula anatina TaxID=7574 RepID=A0A1S3IT71_LINAN|nr:spermatogenesis-associated serine-rich protein 1-like [Lingula anatina]XP_013401405.1 spermatogenesis-associated serine-rich protein 1-like [Lingula anatina]|eukprot:XP_013389114.1 spermatogenesis-associated serine-rich protein 1-like [Lingula anatina]
MLHLTTEIGKSGIQELEKRHFPDIHNRRGPLPHYKPTGRVYIPHGYGEQPDWRPHNENITPRYSEAGPDWKSQLRYIPSPRNEEGIPIELWPDSFPRLRYFPGKFSCTEKEWSQYPEGYHIGKRSKWNGLHFRSAETTNEISHLMLYGKGRKLCDIDQRNGIACASLGDKQYQAPEYSYNFHKFGSTRPIVNFGGAMQDRPKPDTFVPLQDLPTEPSENFVTKERKRKHEEEVNVVKELETWKPATPLSQTLPQQDKDK